MKIPLHDVDETTLSFGIGLVSGGLNAALTRKPFRDAIITTLTGGIVAVLAAPYLHTLLAKYVADNPQDLFYVAVFAVGLFAKDALYWLLNNKRIWLQWIGLGKALDAAEKAAKGTAPETTPNAQVSDDKSPTPPHP